MSTTAPSPDALSLLSHIRPPVTLNGLELRPITVASHTLCIQAGSQLVAGVKQDQIKNLPYEVLLFTYIHAAPLDEVCEAVFEQKRLRRAVFALGEKFPLSSMDEIASKILLMLDQATGNMVSPEPKAKTPSEAAREAQAGKA